MVISISSTRSELVDSIVYDTKEKSNCLNKDNTVIENRISQQSSVERNKIEEYIYSEPLPDHDIEEKLMRREIFGDPFGREMDLKIFEHMKDFYMGKLNQKEMNDYFVQCCSEMRNYRMDQYKKSGEEKEIISKMYEFFAKNNAIAARNTSFCEGEQIRLSYGPTEGRFDWVYYNSDLYYTCEEEKSELRKIASKMAEQWNVSDIDPQAIEDNSILTADGRFDYNSSWNFSSRNQVGRGSIADESMVPPKNFKLFFTKAIVLHQIY